jgi:hypothetical protein
MKRLDLVRHPQAHGCRLDREGAKHSLWLNPATGAVESVPRHAEIGKHLSRTICRQLSVPEPRGA